MLPLYAVFGSPIGHSLSPRIHNAAFAEAGILAHYLPVEVRRGDLVASLDAFRHLGGVGVNLTRPLKETIFPFLEDLSDLAETARAANTIVWRDHGWVGDNTDVRALIAKLEPLVGGLAKRRALIIGSGGVARGSMVSLKHLGMEVWIASRQPVDWGDQWISLQEMPACADWEVVVNATPLGQHGEAHWTFWPSLSSGKTAVVDWVYHPRATPLLQLASSLDCPIVDGLELLIEQARWSWNLWFGQLAPRDAMTRAVDQ